MKTLLAASLIGGASVLCASAQTTGTPEFDPLGEHLDLQKQVRVQVEFIEMPQEKLIELLMPQRRGADDSDLRMAAHEMVKKKEAKVLETTTLVTRSGQRAKVESIKEFIYPTEYDPPEISEGARKGTNANAPVIIGEAAIAPPNPTAFEMRPVGTTFEVDPVVGADGITIELNLAPEIVYHAGNTVYGKWKTPEAETEVTQPEFYTMKVSTAITTISGQYQLVTSATPNNEGGDPDRERKVLVFVRADILAVGLSNDGKRSKPKPKPEK